MPGDADFARKIRAQAVMEKPLTRRFYKSVEIAAVDGNWHLTLDGGVVKAPSKNTLELPSEALAEAVAAEWKAQEEHINPASMPFTKLANTALDRVAPDRVRITDEIVSYANSDLLCYRAEQPVELVLRQTKMWDPLLEEFRSKHGAGFTCLAGVMHADQPQETLDAMRRAVEQLNPYQITGLHNAMTLTGSAIMALALTNSPSRAEELWAAAHVDEDWQIEQWGEDEEAVAHRALREAEFGSTAKFISFLG